MHVGRLMSVDVKRRHPSNVRIIGSQAAEPLFPHPRQKKRRKTVVYSAVRDDKDKDKDESEICEEEQGKKGKRNEANRQRMYVLKHFVYALRQ